MGQFVGDKVASGACLGLVLPLPEEDVPALRKGPGIHPPGNPGGLGIVVNPDLAEIGPESRLEVFTRFFFQGAAAALHQLLDAFLRPGRHPAAVVCLNAPGLDLFFLTDVLPLNTPGLDLLFFLTDVLPLDSPGLDLFFFLTDVLPLNAPGLDLFFFLTGFLALDAPGLRFFFFVRGLLVLNERGNLLGKSGLRQKRLVLRHGNHPARHFVRFLFVLIAGGGYTQLVLPRQVPQAPG
jgi:hypothetical protein